MPIVRALPIFGSVPEQAAVDLVGSGELLEYGEGELLIKQGEQSDYALVVVGGVIEVMVESKYGLVQLAALEAPALVGEIGIFTDVPRTASIQAKTKVQAVKLGGEQRSFGFRPCGASRPRLVTFSLRNEVARAFIDPDG